MEIETKLRVFLMALDKVIFPNISAELMSKIYQLKPMVTFWKRKNVQITNNGEVELEPNPEHISYSLISVNFLEKPHCFY